NRRNRSPSPGRKDPRCRSEADIRSPGRTTLNRREESRGGGNGGEGNIRDEATDALGVRRESVQARLRLAAGQGPDLEIREEGTRTHIAGRQVTRNILPKRTYY